MRLVAGVRTGVVSALVLWASAAAGKGLGTVTVDSGDFDRLASPVGIQLPAVLAGKSLELRTPGSRLTLVVDTQGQGRFVLPRLKRGRRVTYHLVENPSPPARSPGVEASVDREGLWLSLDGKKVLFYRTLGAAPRETIGQELVRGGYIHPVFTPSGRAVTDDYPEIHKHHHGIWTAWATTDYDGRKPDFWNMGTKTGRKDHVSLSDTFGSAVAGGFTARLSSTDLTATPHQVVVDESWRVILHHTHPRSPPYYLFDLEWTDTVLGKAPLGLPESLYGGLALRGPGEWNGEQNARFLSSEGNDRRKGENTTARWYFLGGDVAGKPAGIAVLGHPGNFRAPQPVRIHAKEPYFSVAPAKAGRFVIDPGKPFASRYRFVTIDGRPDAKLLDRLWNDYAHPVEASAQLIVTPGS